MLESLLADFFSLIFIAVSCVTYYIWCSKFVYPFLPSFFAADQDGSDEDVNDASFEKLLHRLFATTISLSMLLIQLYLFQIINFLSSGVNRLAFKLSLNCLMFLIVLLIPLIIIYLLTSHFYQFFDIDSKISKLLDKLQINNGNLSTKQVTTLTVLFFICWLTCVSKIQLLFPSTRQEVQETTSKLIKVSSNDSITAKYIINISLIGITMMGSITGFNSLITIYKNVFKKSKPTASSSSSSSSSSSEIANSKPEQISILKQNLKILLKNHQEISDLLESRRQKYLMLKRSVGLEAYSQQNINDLQNQVATFQNYLKVIKSNILKTKNKINNLEASTSVFFDIINLNFTKFSSLFNKIMVVYCSYRYISIILIKLPLFIYSYLFTPNNSSNHYHNHNNIGNDNEEQNSHSSLSINLKNYLSKNYYQNTIDELSLLNTIELFISICFFITCFTGVLNTFNNLILIASKISSERKLLSSMMKSSSSTKRNLHKRMISEPINDNPYSQSISNSPIQTIEISNQSPRVNNDMGNPSISVENHQLQPKMSSPLRTPKREFSKSISTGSARIKYSQNVALTPTRGNFIKSLTPLNSRLQEAIALEQDPDSVYVNNDHQKYQEQQQQQQTGLLEPFQTAAQYSEIDLKQPLLKPASHFNDKLTIISSHFDNLNISENLELFASQTNQAKLISSCEKLLISELTVIYIISTSLMIRSTFGNQSVNIINNLFGLFEFDIHYLENLFEFWFVVASAITCLVLVFDRKKSLIFGTLIGNDEGFLDEESSIVQNFQQY
ncbi:hypothetical protein DASC09_011620 [Saccharomycopsis crataegensis]|uniref:Abscisic acid G-protein coupled receptor-like domain-containing protein n=1 Tax=Saccharomycopsis crataegensis TaxID=43959 RepID=A0AAV5QGC8_9ASCO|nr:hypothetical protein DASC09_011620 [Saccharomycopsis crataegensis]